MNQSNLYSYFILSGVWNDLDLDVLLLVKEYLQVHLDRRLLNKDYNIFLEKTKEKLKLLSGKDLTNPFSLEDTMDVRYALRYDAKKTYYNKNRVRLLYPIDYFNKYKYYISGVQIRTYESKGMNVYFRRCFAEDFVFTYSPDNQDALNAVRDLFDDDTRLNEYIRSIMEREDSQSGDS